MKRLALPLVVACGVLLPRPLPALTPGSIDPAFRSGLVRVGNVNSLARQPDGRVIIAGRFENVQGRLSSGIARLLPNGRLDTSFNPGLGLNGGGAYRVALQSDGKILVVGEFSRCHLTSVVNVTRLLPNGAVDPAFACQAPGEVRAVLPLPDGRILIAGDFTQVNGSPRGRIARLNPNGSLDTTFAPPSGANGGRVRALALVNDKYYLVGDFTSFNGTSRPGIARILDTGALDTSFNPGSGASGIYDIALDSDSRPVIVGSFSTYNGVSSPGIARLLTNGARDTSFAIGSGIPGFVARLRIQSNGAILLAGAFSAVDGTPRLRAARLRADGALDPAFNLGTAVEGELYDILPSGSSLLLGGNFSLSGSSRRTMCAQVTAAGRPSAAFNPAAVTGEYTVVNHIAAQPDGKILICGAFTSYAGAPRRAVARIFANGRLDPSFDPRGGPLGQILDSATQPDGRIILVGTFSSFDGVPRARVARLLPDGRLDPSFNPGAGPDNIIQSVALAPDGGIYVGGNFTLWGASARGRIARLTPGGSLDPTFAPIGVSGTMGPYVTALAVNPSTSALTLGGNFATCNGVARPNIARLSSTGSLDTTFNPGSGTDGAISDLLLTDAFGTVLLAGDFTTYNGSPRNRIAVAASNGSLGTTFNPGSGFDGFVHKLDRQLNGRILAVGEFTQYNSDSAPGIARIESGGALDATFNTGGGPLDPPLYAVAALPSGRLLVGGEFRSFDRQPQAGIVALLGSLEASGARFAGALQPIAPATELAGSFNLTVTAGNVFSAVIRQRRGATTFRGAFDFEGRWTGFFRRSDGVELAATLTLSRSTVGYGEYLIIGNFISPEGGGQLVAFKPLAPTGSRLVPGLTGYYTSLLTPSVVGNPALPEGYGILTLTQTATGSARLSGTTGDGRPFTASTVLGSGGLLVLHANLPGGAGGYLNGNLFVSLSTPGRIFGGTLAWHRRPGPDPYAAGFTQSVLCEGSLYLRPAGIFLDFASAANNSRLTLDLGHLPASITRLLTIDPANRVTPNAAGSIADLRLTVNPRTGLFGGSFLPPGNTRRATLRGIATTFPKTGRGHTLFPASGDTPPLRSSRLALTPP